MTPTTAPRQRQQLVSVNIMRYHAVGNLHKNKTKNPTEQPFNNNQEKAIFDIFLSFYFVASSDTILSLFSYIFILFFSRIY